MTGMYERLIRKYQVGPFVRRMFFLQDGAPHIAGAAFLGPVQIGPRVHLCRHGMRRLVV